MFQIFSALALMWHLFDFYIFFSDYTSTRVVIRVIITKINDNRFYDTSIYTVFLAVFFFNFDHMFFCFCPHIFCNFPESGVREFFNIF